MISALARIRARLAADRGFTLIEVLVAGSLMIVVLTATLNALDRTTQVQRKTEKRNDQQENLRVAIDRMSTQLRNLASPTTSAVKTVDTATSYDLIFQTTDPNKQWVRYCLADGTNSPVSFPGFVNSTQSNERIWYQTPNNDFLALNPAKSPSQVTSPSMTSTCPVAPKANGSGAGWLTASVVAEHITNKTNSLDRPLFTTNMVGSDTSTITYLHADTYNSFATATNNPAESRLSSGVYLRNQNQAPTAVIQYQQGSGGPTSARTFQFNGTLSSDPEGRTLQFLWYKGTPAASATATAAKLPSCATTAPADQTKTTSGETWTCLGSGALLSYPFPTTDGNSTAVALKVTDPGGLPGLATQNSISLP